MVRWGLHPLLSRPRAVSPTQAPVTAAIDRARSWCTGATSTAWRSRERHLPSATRVSGTAPSSERQAQVDTTGVEAGDSTKEVAARSRPA